MDKKYKTLIIDDERLARKDLLLLLKEHGNIDVVGEAEDVPSALKAINDLNPDLIFLDIQMPGESGFDLLDKTKIQSKIIFVTAFDEYAIRAFEINALDYLLKPIHPDRLARAIDRLESIEENGGDAGRQLEYEDRLFLTIDTRMRFLKVNSIMSITAAGDYSEVLTKDGEKGLALKSMKEWENRLPDTYFVRIHRSTIINMEYIERLEEWFNYSYRVYLKGVENPFVMSRRYAVKLKQKMG